MPSGFRGYARMISDSVISARFSSLGGFWMDFLVRSQLSVPFVCSMSTWPLRSCLVILLTLFSIFFQFFDYPYHPFSISGAVVFEGFGLRVISK